MDGLDMQNVRLGEDGKAVVILDQSLLPGETRYIEIRTPEEMYEAIRHLKVRGAPAIGIFAAYCMYVLSVEAATAAMAEPEDSSRSFLKRIRKNGDHLKSSRPTAVNLAWAVDRMVLTAQTALEDLDKKPADPQQGEAGERALSIIPEIMRQEAVKIHEEDMAMCRAIAEHGLTLIEDGDGILTHCNAGPLATSQYGTALGPILLGKERGLDFKVFADETRPLLQGARLTTYELNRAGVDVTLICDNMASMVMKNGWIKACLVGCDRVAANGDTANKIGTSGVAILAKHYGIPFYVLGPSSTVDLDCPTGDDIPIELRDPDEIREKFYSRPMAPEGVGCYNPAFDVTDSSLITAIVTEQGICRPPFHESLGEAVARAERQKKGMR
ncbi:MAG: S-methyl-5-thioribose-1-phosphate isomerase [Bacillota bacterium]|nr:S-methyl-5-thioribose-1-phosphate isomerase [Bacillota bacterium]